MSDSFKALVLNEIVELLRKLHGSDDDQKNMILSLSMVTLISSNNDCTLEQAQAAKSAKMPTDQFIKYMDDGNFDWRFYYNRKILSGDENR